MKTLILNLLMTPANLTWAAVAVVGFIAHRLLLLEAKGGAKGAALMYATQEIQKAIDAAIKANNGQLTQAGADAAGKAALATLKADWPEIEKHLPDLETLVGMKVAATFGVTPGGGVVAMPVTK